MRFTPTLTCFIKHRLFSNTGNIEQKGAQGRMQGLPPLPCPMRLKQVLGFEGRTNDIVYCLPKSSDAPPSAVVYFGGDVQDFAEVMEKHRDNKNYLKWNIENTGLILQALFPQSHIIVVKPARSVSPKLSRIMDTHCDDLDFSRMEFKTFACYDNFVPSNNCGAPDHTPNHNALLHLQRLLQSLTLQIKTIAKAEAEQDADIKFPALDKADIQLIGFSKGCVVLNQFLYEFHYSKTLTPEDDSASRIVPHISNMYWLDGGHAGGKNTWITSFCLLETLSRLDINIHVHVTPYQVNDDRRPWIKREEKSFCETLKRVGAPIQRTLHFENQVPSLNTHFQLISEFRKEET